MKYFTAIYGCQMNISDTERASTILEGLGYQPTGKITEADLVLVSMCSVRQSAVDRIYGLAINFKKLKKKPKKILIGCVLNKDKKKLAEVFDFILGAEDFSQLPKMLGQEVCTKLKSKYFSKLSACLPIMTGCNNFCAYCVVPYTRGREISLPATGILKEVKSLVKNGYKEIWLLGQNVNSYHSVEKGRKIEFADLLKMIDNVPGKFWIRFTSPHPKDFSGDLIKTMAEAKKVTPYLNLPIQSGDDTILKKMNRPYTVRHYKDLVKKIREAFVREKKELALSTDVIVGFPGETEKQFNNTLNVFQEIKYDMAYINRYSPRSQTAAFKMKDTVTSQEKKDRENILNEALKITAREKNNNFIDEIVEVLVQESKKGFLIGKTGHLKTVKFKGPQNLTGKFVKVKIKDAGAWGMKGELIKKDSA
ncbi:MAG: tRNA (N6-isopentenyl adenosine(37)-C2)-methylthiotransferase MiaB [bacterium]